jgi:RNA polymerase sigma factor for flagellar operon FliA
VDPDAVALVETHLGLAQSLAQQEWRKAPHALEADELRAIAYFGLCAAAERWKPYCAEKGYSPEALQFFKPFVVRRVKGAIIDAIRKSDWAGRNLRARAKALQEASGEATGEARLSHAELAERTGMSEKNVRSTVRDMAQRRISLEAEDLDPGDSTDVESSVFTRTVLSGVVAVIRTLAPDQQAVLALHYHNGLKLQEIAFALGITETRASQLHADAVLAVHAAMLDAATHRSEP